MPSRAEAKRLRRRARIRARAAHPAREAERLRYQARVLDRGTAAVQALVRAAAQIPTTDELAAAHARRQAARKARFVGP